MSQQETNFDALLDAARKLKLGFISGPLQPPEAGRLWLAGHDLADILLPAWADRPIAIAILAGGPGREHISTGEAVLSSDDLARLEQLTAAAGGHVYQGRLRLLTPADWLRLHGEDPQRAAEAEPPPRPGGWQDDPTTAHIATLATGPVYEAARAAGWPSTFADEPVLFLDDQPLYHLLMREDVGRVVTLLIGALGQ